jgi:AcrR family transcriptional regulator
MPAEQRRAQIVAAARELMVEHGYSAVTIRAVADACGVSPAAVQYFYPDKASLYTAMIEQMTAHMDGVYARISGQPDAGVPPLAAFLRFLLFDDIMDRATAGFFYELWSLAHREPIAARALAALYEQQLIRLVALIRAASPDVDVDEATHRAVVIMAATDGLMMTIGYGKQAPSAVRGAGKDRTLGILLNIAEHG